MGASKFFSPYGHSSRRRFAFRDHRCERPIVRRHRGGYLPWDRY